MALSIISIAIACNSNACPSCDLEPETGPCRALISKFYFDKDDKKCKEFSWGGCNGVVPFETLEECEACGCTD